MGYEPSVTLARLANAPTTLGLVASEAALVRSGLARLHAAVLEGARALVLGAGGELAFGATSRGHGESFEKVPDSSLISGTRVKPRMLEPYPVRIGSASVGRVKYLKT